MTAKPAWKWTGGKGQLLSDLHKRLDPLLAKGGIDTYVEPFIGAGALMWSVIGTNKIENVYFGDMNGEMITLYKVIKDSPEELSARLAKLADEFLEDGDQARRQKMYYAYRNAYNALLDKYPDSDYAGDDAIEMSAIFMFMNRTCFNGLYWVNRSGHFNVPCGKYKQPPIDQSSQIMENSKLLNSIPNLKIAHAGYEESIDWINERTFVYFDPPYRPITSSSAFTAYVASGFNDDNQKELAQFCREVDAKGGKFMLSNSDPHNEDPDDDFFDDLYKGFTIERVQASRAINSDKDKRGKISEILVRNF